MCYFCMYLLPGRSPLALAGPSLSGLALSAGCKPFFSYKETFPGSLSVLSESLSCARLVNFLVGIPCWLQFFHLFQPVRSSLASGSMMVSRLVGWPRKPNMCSFSHSITCASTTLQYKSNLMMKGVSYAKSTAVQKEPNLMMKFGTSPSTRPAARGTVLGNSVISNNRGHDKASTCNLGRSGRSIWPPEAQGETWRERGAEQ